MPIHSISHVLQCGDLYRISHDSFFCDYWWLVSLKGLTHIKIVCVPFSSEYRVIFVVRINKRKKVINLFLFFFCSKQKPLWWWLYQCLVQMHSGDTLKYVFVCSLHKSSIYTWIQKAIYLYTFWYSWHHSHYPRDLQYSFVK